MVLGLYYKAAFIVLVYGVLVVGKQVYKLHGGASKDEQYSQPYR